ARLKGRKVGRKQEGSRGTKRKALGDHEGELQVREVDDPGKSISFIVHCNVLNRNKVTFIFEVAQLPAKYNHREIPQTSTINSQINMESEPAASSGVILLVTFPFS
ncbi:hypothetical protein CEXT_417981, partial [Caerostris extrusa]